MADLAFWRSMDAQLVYRAQWLFASFVFGAVYTAADIVGNRMDLSWMTLEIGKVFIRSAEWIVAVIALVWMQTLRHAKTLHAYVGTFYAFAGHPVTRFVFSALLVLALIGGALAARLLLLGKMYLPPLGMSWFAIPAAVFAVWVIFAPGAFMKRGRANG